uniref:Uncharacterized protein n=1 Tax=Oryza glumipatula TaxID=40148 RepID=A0A0D9YCI7_9ORYZ
MVPPMRIEDGSSQFLPGHAAFSVSMPMFPTGMNDQWHGASYNIALYIMNVHRRPNDGICQQHGPTENHVTTTNQP